MERWNGKVAVVTGASSGIGATIVRDLVKAEMKVVGLARRVERVEDIAEELKTEKGKLYAVKCDISKEEDVKTAFAWAKANLGGVDVLINNAGLVKFGKLVDEGNSELLRSVLDTNVWGLCICTREAVSSMRERNVAGHIVHINSIVGHTVINAIESGMFAGAYPASKFAVTALTESLRQELIHLDTKIKVTSISPGVVATELNGDNKLPEGYPALQSEDVSNAVLYVLGTPPHVQLKCDVSKEEEIKTAFAWVKTYLGGIDVLINNAGIVKLGKLVDEGNSDSLRSVLDTNVWGLCICTREAVKSMRERNVAGHIVHINSVVGHLVINRLETGIFVGVYPASKFAVTALTESLRQELIHQGTKIKVTSVRLGIVATEIMGDVKFPEHYPVLQPEDVSNAVLYALGTPPHV